MFPQVPVTDVSRPFAALVTGALLLVAAPAIAFAGLGIFRDPAWHAASLAAGVGLGVLVLALGVWGGGRLFERRGPEILAAAVRA